MFTASTIFLLILFVNQSAAAPYRIQGTVIFPNGTSVYADHELPRDPGPVDEKQLFTGLFQLAGNLRMGPIVIGDARGEDVVRGSVQFPDGRKIKAYRTIIQGIGNTVTENQGKAVYSFGESGGRAVGGLGAVQPPSGFLDDSSKGNAYYFEQDRYGAFVYTEGETSSPQDIRVSATVTREECGYSPSKPEGKLGQFYLLRAQPCGNEERRQTAKLDDGTQFYFYGKPTLVHL